MCKILLALGEKPHQGLLPSLLHLNKELIANFDFSIQIHTSPLLLSAWMEPDQAIVAKDD